MKTHDNRRILALVFALGALPYLAALGAGFVFDDAKAIVGNPLVSGEVGLSELFARDFWGRQAAATIGTYRPVAVLSFIVDQAAGGGKPWAFHASNIILHSLCCVALFVYLAQRFGRPLAIASTSLFCVHAVHTENVAAIVARADVLATLLVLLTLHFARQENWRRWLVGPCFLLALLSKEVAVAGIAIVLADLVLNLDSKVRRRLLFVALVSMLAALVAYLGMRYAALGVLTTSPKMQGNPLVDASLLERLFTCAELLWRSVGLMVAPINLQADYSFPAIVPTTAMNLGVALGTALWIALPATILAARRRAPAIAWGAAVMLASYVPVSNLLVLSPTIFAERLLYFPSIGFVVLVAWGALAALRVFPRHKNILRLLFAAVLCTHVLLSALRTTDWTSNRSLFSADVVAGTPSMLAHLQLGYINRTEGNFAEARLHYERAIVLAPKYADPYSGLGLTLDLQGDPKGAHDALQHALKLAPDCRDCSLALGTFLVKYGRFEAAEAELRRLQALPGAQSAVSRLQEQLAGARAQHPGR